MTGWRVLGCRGCGSTIVEAALVLAGIPYDREEADYEIDSPERDRLFALNPLGQVPTVILPDGSVMTESAAIVLYLDETYPAAQLLPRPGDPLRRDALRWLVFLVAAVYPTFTYGDHPEKWVDDTGAALRRTTDLHREHLWKQIESQVTGPWFLGDRRSILDIYVSVMTRWRPRRAWFANHAPKLDAIASAVDTDPRLASLWDANFS